MHEPKAIARFAILSMAVYALLTWMFPLCEREYAAWFRGTGNVALARLWFWPEGSVRFLDLHSSDPIGDISAHLPGKLPRGFKPPEAEGVKDTLLLLQNRETPAHFGLLRTSSRIMGFTPTAVLLSLALATPIRWRRRFWVLLWGLVLVHVFIVARLTVLVVNNGFAADKPYALFHPGRFAIDLLHRLDEVMTDNPTFSYLVPVFLWLVVWMGLELWSSLGRNRPAADAPRQRG